MNQGKTDQRWRSSLSGALFLDAVHDFEFCSRCVAVIFQIFLSIGAGILTFLKMNRGGVGI